MPVPALADRSLFRGYRFRPEVITHAVWLYYRFHLSLRDVQDLLAERAMVVSHATIRHWCETFGPTFAAGLRKRRARPRPSCEAYWPAARARHPVWSSPIS